MKILCVLLILIIICLIIGILYYISYSDLIVINVKIDNANKNINDLLEEKYNAMNELYLQIKKVTKKKDYLKDFSEMNKVKKNNYEKDNELNDHLKTMISMKEDYKSLNNDKCNTILNNIKCIDEKLIANKRFFNKNNNLLIKKMKGYNKFVAKINHIIIKNSYDLKNKTN